jgi:hypothetical protein
MDPPPSPASPPELLPLELVEPLLLLVDPLELLELLEALEEDPLELPELDPPELEPPASSLLPPEPEPLQANAVESESIAETNSSVRMVGQRYDSGTARAQGRSAHLPLAPPRRFIVPSRREKRFRQGPRRCNIPGREPARPEAHRVNRLRRRNAATTTVGAWPWLTSTSPALPSGMRERRGLSK